MMNTIIYSIFTIVYITVYEPNSGPSKYISHHQGQIFIYAHLVLLLFIIIIIILVKQIQMQTIIIISY